MHWYPFTNQYPWREAGVLVCGMLTDHALVLIPQPHTRGERGASMCTDHTHTPNHSPIPLVIARGAGFLDRSFPCTNANTRTSDDREGCWHVLLPKLVPIPKTGTHTRNWYPYPKLVPIPETGTPLPENWYPYPKPVPIPVVSTRGAGLGNGSQSHMVFLLSLRIRDSHRP